MKKRYAALAIALASLLAFVVFAASQNDPAQEVGQAYVPPAPVAEQQGNAAAPAPRAAPIMQEPAPAPVTNPVQAKQPPASEPEQPAVRTGCGKAVPCPNRDCKDCPYNIYLK
jgi:hypothetical protein